MWPVKYRNLGRFLSDAGIKYLVVPWALRGPQKTCKAVFLPATDLSDKVPEPPLSSLLAVVFFAYPIYCLCKLSSYFSVSGRNSDSGSLGRLFSPLATTVCAFMFIARRLQPFLPSSSTRSELRTLVLYLVLFYSMTHLSSCLLSLSIPFITHYPCSCRGLLSPQNHFKNVYNFMPQVRCVCAHNRGAVVCPLFFFFFFYILRRVGKNKP